MATAVTFALFNASRNPITGATPVLISYRSPTGVVLPPPGIIERGGGFYEFLVGDEALTGVAYLIDGGATALARYHHGGLGPLVAFAIFDANGQPQTGQTPVFSWYADEVGAPRARPEIRELGGGLYGFVPLADTPAPRYIVAGAVWGSVDASTRPNVVDMTPPPGTPLSPAQSVTFDVIDAEANLGRVMLAIQYEKFGGATELAWDGSSSVGPHQVSFVPIFNGRRYTILRNGGWPAPFTLRIFAADLVGNEV